MDLKKKLVASIENHPLVEFKLKTILCDSYAYLVEGMNSLKDSGFLKFHYPSSIRFQVSKSNHGPHNSG